jgi:hypothetical protein
MGGFRDILAWLLGWRSAHKYWQTEGPYRLAAGEAFCAGAAVGEAFHAGAAAAIVSAGNITAGECNG